VTELGKSRLYTLTGKKNITLQQVPELFSADRKTKQRNWIKKQKAIEMGLKQGLSNRLRS